MSTKYSLYVEYKGDYESGIIRMFKSLDDAQKYALENLFIPINFWQKSLRLINDKYRNIWCALSCDNELTQYEIIEM